MTVGGGWERPASGCRRSIPIGACVDFTTKITGDERSENLGDHVDAVQDLGGPAFDSSWLNRVPNLHRPVIQLKSPHSRGPGPSGQESFRPRGHWCSSCSRYRNCRGDRRSRCRRHRGCSRWGSGRRYLKSGCRRRSTRRYSGGCCWRLRRSWNDRRAGSRRSGYFGATATRREDQQQSDSTGVPTHGLSLPPPPGGAGATPEPLGVDAGWHLGHLPQ